jgi:hypothetical protein
MGTSTAREALIIEAIGEVARLINQVEALAPEMEETCQALHRSDAKLQQTLAGFEARLAAISERAKTQAVQDLRTHLKDSAQQVGVQLYGALAAAAQQAFQGQIGATVKGQQLVLKDLQALLQELAQQRDERWIPWATHAAATCLGAMFTLTALWLSR